MGSDWGKFHKAALNSDRILQSHSAKQTPGYMSPVRDKKIIHTTCACILMIFSH